MEHVRDTIEFVVNNFMDNTDLSDAVSDATGSDVGEADMELSTEDEVVVGAQRKKAYAICDICGLRFKARGLHVHKRKHEKEDILVEETGVSSSVEGDVNGFELSDLERVVV